MEDGIVRLTRKEMTERLERLGIKRVDLSTMLEIVGAFMNGEKNLALYRKRPGGNLASPNTIVKLRRIYNEEDAGQNLDFLRDEINRQRIEIGELIEGDAEGVERASKQKYPGSETVALFLDEEIEEQRKNEVDPFGEFRLAIIQRAEGLLDDFVWGVSNLEGIGIPPQEAISILNDFKRLNIARRRAEFTDKSSVVLRDFKGFDRYLEVLWLVILTKQFLDDLIASGDYDVQYNRIVRATKLHARGVFENDEAIMSASEGYLQFEPWRSSEYKDAYEESLKIYQRPRKGHARFLKQIRAQLYDAEDLFQLVVDLEQEPAEEMATDINSHSHEESLQEESDPIEEVQEVEAPKVHEAETKPLALSWMMDDFQTEEVSDELIEKLKGQSLGSSDEWRKALDAARGQLDPPPEEEIAANVEEQIISRLSDLWNPRGIADEEEEEDE